MSRSPVLLRHGEWLGSAASALVLSLVTVFLLAAVVLSLGLIWEKDSLWERDYVSIRDIALDASGERAAFTFWYQPARGRIHRVQLGMHGVSGADSAVQIPWPRLDPTCVLAPPTSNRLVVGTSDGALLITNLAETPLDPDVIGQQADGEVLCLECTADARLLVSTGYKNVYAWNLESRAPLWCRDDLEANCIAIHPHAPRLVCGLRDGRIVELDLATGRDLRSLAQMTFPVRQVAISPDGQTVAGIGAEGRILALDSASAEVRWQDYGSPNHAGGFRVASFSPCGKMLVTVAKDNVRMMTIWSAATGQHRGFLHGHTRAILGASFTADGTFYSWGADGTIRTWNVEQNAPLSVTSLTIPAQTG